MATFAQWTKAQAERDDSIGYFSRYWEKVSPGKISSVEGVGRHLEKVQADLRQIQADSGRSDDLDTQKALAQVDAAIAGYGLAVKEYHDAEAPNHDARALARDLPTAPEPTGKFAGQIELVKPPRPPSVQGSHRTAREGPAVPQNRYTGWPEERFNRLEAQNERLAAQNVQLIELCSALVRQQGELIAYLRPQRINWPQLWESASRDDSAGAKVRQQQ